MDDTRRWWLSAADLHGILADLARRATLIGPVRLGGEVVFRQVGGPDEMCRDYVNSLVPPKHQLLPASERLLRYRLEQGQPTLVEDGDGGELPDLVFYGIRSCDVAGLAYLTRFFSGEIFGRPDTADSPFMRRRVRATLLSVVCQDPAETCMCVCCDGGPALTAAYDWQLTELGYGWLAEIGSPRGAALAQRYAESLRPARHEEVQEKEQRVQGVVDRFFRHSGRRVQTMSAGRMLSRGRLAHTFWADVGERCFECGGCAFVCPTCSCFNVADLPETGTGELGSSAEGVPSAVPGGATEVPDEGRFERIRLRDCCMLAGFVRQAGGGYPRWTCGERCLTRFFHKLSWQFHERMGMLGCTGCGRCAIVCLGGIGIDAVSERMTLDLVSPGAPAARPRAARPRAGYGDRGGGS